MNRRTTAATSTAVGVVLALACAWFVGHRLAGDWSDARDAVTAASVGWLVAAVVLAAAGMTAIALGWRAVLAELGHRYPTRLVVAWYFTGEIGKYLPGGVWPILGRGELARRGGVRRTAAYSSVALSLGLLYLAAALVACVLLPFAIDGADGRVALVLLLPPVGIACLHPAISGRVEALAARVLRRPIDVRVPTFGEALALVARYVPAWLLIGGATWSVARALDPHADLTRVLLATAVSWLAGFLAVPVPGGVGVREAVFVAAAGTMPGGVAASTAVLARVIFVAVDAAGAVLSARSAPRRPPSTGAAAAPPAPRTAG
ncbi:MAG: hypothetical protein JWO68_2984 [Actinomycetia bacterium]|nr:hypothetical protein [Actinomycetes bacterium]